MNHFQRIVTRLTTALHHIGSSFLALMMFLTAIDVFMRYFLNRPIIGSVEITEFTMIIVVFLGVAYVGLEQGHTSIDILVSRASPKSQAFINCIVHFLCFAFLLIMLWGALTEAIIVLNDNIESMLLHIPVFPFVILMAVGIALFALVNLLDFINNFFKILRK